MEAGRAAQKEVAYKVLRPGEKGLLKTKAVCGCGSVEDRALARKGGGKRNPEKITVNMNCAYPCMLVHAVNGVFMVGDLIMDKVMGCGGKEKYSHHNRAHDLMQYCESHRQDLRDKGNQENGRRTAIYQTGMPA